MEVVSEDPVPALGIIRVEAAKYPDQVLLLGLTPGNRPFHPLVVRLLREPEYPARHRHRHPDTGTCDGHLTDERVDHFGGVMCICDKYAAARRSTSFSISSSRTRFKTCRISRCSSGSFDVVIPRVANRES